MKTFVKEIDGFKIYFEALEENSCIDENWSDDEEMRNDTIKKLNNFDLVMFCAKITAEKNGIELADDYLGMCIYENEESFYNTKGCYFDDMCNTVINEAKVAIRELSRDITQHYHSI